MEITATLVKELREKTGVGMMDCKKALSHAQGNFEEAIKYLREKGLSAVSKKSDRETKEGKVFIQANAQGTAAVIVELNCETDFVANNVDFEAVGTLLAKEAIAQNLNSVEALSTASANGLPIATHISEAILKLGENITIKQVSTLQAGALASYIHMNGKIGVIVGFTTAIADELGRDIAMHIAALAPQYLKPSDVPASEIEKESEIIKNQALNEGKPAEIAEKVVQGRINKFYKEICLLEQPFVKDQEQTIQKLLQGKSEITGFLRVALG